MVASIIFCTTLLCLFNSALRLGMTDLCRRAAASSLAVSYQRHIDRTLNQMALTGSYQP